MPEPIQKLWEQEPPKRAVLLGKGPSLGKFNIGFVAGECVVGLNECGEQFKCDYAISVDKVMKKLDLSHTIPIRQAAFPDFFDGRGYTWQRRVDVERPYSKYTATNALVLFAKWGVKDFLMVGFDGWDTKEGNPYWDGLSVVRPRRKNNGLPDADFSKINDRIARAIEQYDLNCKWCHRGEWFDG